MDRNLTISVKGILVAGLVLLGLLAAYLVGSAGAGPTTTANAAAEEQTATRRTVVMGGTGTATAVPDQVSFTVSVGVSRPELANALEVGNVTMRKVLRALKTFGVGAKNMQTTGLSMNPVYDYPPYSEPVLTGYRVTQKARVTVPELAQAGQAVTAAVTAGGDSVRVAGIRLEISDREAVISKARDAAVEQARAKAQQYAEATGQSLGDVVSIKEVHAVAPQAEGAWFDGYAVKNLSARDAAVPIRAGADELDVTVQVVWEFT